MKKILYFSFLISKSLWAAPVDHVAHFNQGWPAIGEAIPHLSQILSIHSSGPYSWAIGIENNQMRSAFYDGQHWTESTSIENLKGISGIIPFVQGQKAQAFARGADNEIAYFNGETWEPAAPIEDFNNPWIVASGIHAFAINNSTPIKSSLFDEAHHSWTPAVDLSPYLISIRQITAQNNSVYILGVDAQRKLSLLQSEDNQQWRQTSFDLWLVQNVQLIVRQKDIVIAGLANDHSYFEYSDDNGTTFKSSPWPYGLVMAGESGPLWTRNTKQLGYFEQASTEPAWKMLDLPFKKKNAFFSNPSLEGNELCTNGEEADIECYHVNTQQWFDIASIQTLAKTLEGVTLLHEDQLVAMGLNQNNQRSLFYYNGNTWQVAQVSGLLASIKDIEGDTQSMNLWAIGHD